MKSTFDYYRYQLVPNTTRDFSLFDKVYTYEEAKEQKNSFFASFIEDPEISSKKGILPSILIAKQDDKYIFLLSNISSVDVVNNFTTETVKNEPYVVIIIDNDPENQIIAISRNKKAYSSSDVVVGILLANFQSRLDEYKISIYIEPIYSPSTFWGLVEHKSISWIKFELIKPNLANISGAFSGDIRESADMFNSHKTELKYNAPQNNCLENLSRDNQVLDGLVEYASQGGGNITVKDTQNPSISLKQSIKFKTIEYELEIENPTDEMIREFLNRIL